MTEKVIEELREELESEPGGHTHIWFDVDCPTCNAPIATHCSGDAAERPRWMRDDDEYWDKPCAKRVLKAVIKMMEEAGIEEGHRLANAEPRHQPDSDNE